MLLLKEKDWVSPLDDVVKGRELLVNLHDPISEEYEAGIEFPHLFNGDFLWLIKYEGVDDTCGKVIKVHLDRVEWITLLDGITPATISHKGGGIFNLDSVYIQCVKENGC